MAFTANNFIPASGSANSDAGKTFQYKEGATLAAMRAANYFNDAAATYGLKSGDVIMLIGSDGIGFSQATVAANGNVTLGNNITSV